MDRLMATRVFVTIAQRGSLTSAAQILGMSRAMVTRYLTEMEHWVGARLFHRNTRRISLTAAGEQLLPQGLALLAQADQMPQHQHAADTQMNGVLRVACNQSLTQTALMDTVRQFLARYPQSAIDLHVQERTVDLVEERIDLSVRVTNTLDPGLIARSLGSCRSVICAAPAYLARCGLPAAVEDLARHNCLTYAYFGRSLWRFTRGDQPVIDVPVGGNLSANDSMTLLSAALGGVGISMQPWHAAAAHVARGELRVLLADMEPQRLGIHALYTSREHQSVLMRTFLDFLVDSFARSDLVAD